jgi:DNA sulfur modification protein DndC
MKYLRELAKETRRVILLLGVRRSESLNRARIAKRYNTGFRLNPHSDMKFCLVYRPILELTTDDVWEALATYSPPWGESHQDLIQLYRDALGGECPVVTSVSQATGNRCSALDLRR